VQTAVTRKCAIDGEVVGAEQAVSLTEALRAVTLYAAGQIGMADQLGTLQAGKFADLTILEKDPYTVDPDTLMSIAVSQTWVGGRKMYG
jgi:predicted amidohydrolase YtcJ